MAGFKEQLMAAEDRGYRRGFQTASSIDENSEASYERILRMGMRRMSFETSGVMVLRGREGIILRDLLLLMASEGKPNSLGDGSIFVNGRPVVCEHQANKVNYCGYVS